jgi:hypothetical protein
MNRTEAYLFTTHDRNSFDIESLRKEVKVYNLMARTVEIQTGQKQLRQYVKVHGRLGQNNKHAYLYRVGGPLKRYSAQTIRSEHATRFDVYVHMRYVY